MLHYVVEIYGTTLCKSFSIHFIIGKQSATFPIEDDELFPITMTKISQERTNQERTKIGPFFDFLLHFSRFSLKILNIAPVMEGGIPSHTVLHSQGQGLCRMAMVSKDPSGRLMLTADFSWSNIPSKPVFNIHLSKEMQVSSLFFISYISHHLFTSTFPPPFIPC